MSEKITPTDIVLTPEYWNGHEPEDKCPKEKVKKEELPFMQSTSFDLSAGDILEEFLSLEDKSPVKSFKKGELFDATKFPEGTIIRFNQEELYFGKSDRNPDYERKKTWGVVSGYNDKSVRKIVLWCFTEPLWLKGSGEGKLRLKVGETDHTKINDRQVHNNLFRVNKLTLYQLGKGLPEKVKEGALPNFGSIFRRPQPQGA